MVFWFLDEGEGCDGPLEAGWAKEVVGQVLGAVVHAQHDAAGYLTADSPEDVLADHPDELKRVEPVTDPADVGAQTRGLSVLDHG